MSTRLDTDDEDGVSAARARVLASLARLDVELADMAEVIDAPRRLRAVTAVLARMTPEHVRAFEEMVATAKIAGDVKHVALILLDAEVGHVVASRDPVDSSPRARQYCQVTVAGDQPFRVTDAGENGVIRRLFGNRPPVGSYLGVPVHAGDETVGALCMFENGPREWSIEQERMLVRFAVDVSAELSRIASRRDTPDRE